MKYVLLLLLIFIVHPVYGAEPQTSVEQPTPTEQPQRTAPEPGPSTAPREKNQEPWPKPFQPSERIGADSAVSFPVDI